MSVDFLRCQRRNTKIFDIISFLYLSHMKDVFCLHCADNISMKFCQIFLEGYHAGLLWAVKSEPASTPFIWRIRSASMKVYWNLNNTRGKTCRCRRDVSTSPSTLAKRSWAVDKKLVPSIPQVSQNIVEHGSTKETTAPLSTGSIMDFPRANKNNSYWQS